MSRRDQVTARIDDVDELADVVDLYTREDLDELARRDAAAAGSVLDELLVIDGVTDLFVYRLLTGRAGDLDDVDPPQPPTPPDRGRGEQLSLFLLMPGGDG